MDTSAMICLVERGSPQQVTGLPRVGSFASTGIDTSRRDYQLLVSSERHMQCVLKEAA